LLGGVIALLVRLLRRREALDALLLALVCARGALLTVAVRVEVHDAARAGAGLARLAGRARRFLVIVVGRLAPAGDAARLIAVDRTGAAAEHLVEARGGVAADLIDELTERGATQCDGVAQLLTVGAAQAQGQRPRVVVGLAHAGGDEGVEPVFIGDRTE